MIAIGSRRAWLPSVFLMLFLTGWTMSQETQSVSPAESPPPQAEPADTTVAATPADTSEARTPADTSGVPAVADTSAVPTVADTSGRAERAARARRDSLIRLRIDRSGPPPDSVLAAARVEWSYGGRIDRFLAARLPVATHSFGPGPGGELSAYHGLPAEFVRVAFDGVTFQHPLDQSVRLDFLPLEILGRMDDDYWAGRGDRVWTGRGLAIAPLFAAAQESRVSFLRGDHDINQAFFTKRFDPALWALIGLASHGTLDRNLRNRSGVTRYETRWAWAPGERWTVLPSLWIAQANQEMTGSQQGVNRREVNRQRRSHVRAVGPGLGGRLAIDLYQGDYTDKIYSLSGGAIQGAPSRYRTRLVGAAIAGSSPPNAPALDWFFRLEDTSNWGLTGGELSRRSVAAGADLRLTALGSLEWTFGLDFDAVGGVSPGFSPSIDIHRPGASGGGLGLSLSRLYREPSLDSMFRGSPDPRHHYVGSNLLRPMQASEAALRWERLWTGGELSLAGLMRYFDSIIRFADGMEPLYPGRAEAVALTADSGLLWSGMELGFGQWLGPIQIAARGQSWAPNLSSGWGTLPGVPLFRVTGEIRGRRTFFDDNLLVTLTLGGDFLGRRNFPGASLPDQTMSYFSAAGQVSDLRMHLFVDDLLGQNWQGAPGYWIGGPRFAYGFTWKFLD